MTLTLVDQTSDLMQHRESISVLFTEAFDRDLDPATWEWIFLHNPNGPSLVALWHEDGHLVGHNAFVPFRFSNGVNTDIAYRSGTTMISSSAQSPALLAVLGQALQSRCADQRRIVFGFPNANSWQGFKRFLRWDIRPMALVDLPGATILGAKEQLVAGADGSWMLDIHDAEQRRWRLDKPDAHYVTMPGLVTSTHEGAEQLLLLEEDGLPHVNPDTTYRVLLPAENPLALPGQLYRFGFWRPPSGCAIERLAPPQLLWSDVF